MLSSTAALPARGDASRFHPETDVAVSLADGNLDDPRQALPAPGSPMACPQHGHEPIHAGRFGKDGRHSSEDPHPASPAAARNDPCRRCPKGTYRLFSWMCDEPDFSRGFPSDRTDPFTTGFRSRHAQRGQVLRRPSPRRGRSGNRSAPRLHEHRPLSFPEP